MKMSWCRAATRVYGTVRSRSSDPVMRTLESWVGDAGLGTCGGA